MLEMYKGRKTLAVLECLTQYFLSKNTPSRIDLINAILTCLQFGQATRDFNGETATGPHLVEGTAVRPQLVEGTAVGPQLVGISVTSMGRTATRSDHDFDTGTAIGLGDCDGICQRVRGISGDKRIGRAVDKQGRS